MEFGLLTFWGARSGEAQSEAFAENFNEVSEADQMGWDSVWVGGVPLGGMVSQHLVLANAIAARTNKIRIGTAVHIPGLKAPGEEFEAEVPKGGSTIDRRGQNYHRYKYVFDHLAPAEPIQTAQQIAMIDQVSNGRFTYGAGGNTTGRLDRQKQFYEYLQVMRQVWTEEDFSGFKGEFYNYPSIPIGGRFMPRPVQKPHPPILLPLDSQQGFVPMGEMGYHIAIGSGTSHNQRGDEVLKQDVKNYRQAWLDSKNAGESRVMIRISAYVSPTRADFLRKMEAGIEETNKRRAARGLPVRESSASDQTANLYGTPEQVVDRIHELREDFGMDGFMCGMQGGLTREEQLQCLRLFADKVIPEFN